jgi:hypothetical protein
MSTTPAIPATLVRHRSPMWAIASLTFREARRQTEFWLLVGTTAVILAILPSVALFGFSDKLGQLREFAIDTVSLALVIIAALFAGNIVRAEIEGRTILTLLSKSVTRGELLIGKFLGIAAAMVLAWIVLAGFTELMLWWESGSPAYARVVTFDRARFLQDAAAALGLTLFKGVIIGAVAVGTAAFVPSLMTTIVTVAVFWLGHLKPSLDAIWPEGLVARLTDFVYLFLPKLWLFYVGSGLATAEATDRAAVSAVYFVAAAAYAVTYTGLLLGAATLGFRFREVS